MKRNQSSSLLRAHSSGSFSRLVFESEQCNGITVSHDRSLLFRLCQCFVFAVRLVTPFSYIYLLVQYVRPIDPLKYPGGALVYWLVFLWMVAEALFFPYYYYLFTKLNSINEELQHLASDKDSRKKLVSQSFEALLASGRLTSEAPEVYVRKALEGWFCDQSLIKLQFGNVAAWTGWAFFGKDVRHMSIEETQENNEIVEYIEIAAKWKFPPGFSSEIPSYRLNLDPIFATQRPFFFYATISVVNNVTHVILKAMGFRRLDKFASPAQNVYYRPVRADENATNKKLPVVFVHGIGIGFAHYLALISFFPRDVDVFLIEWPYVAMQMATRGPTVDESVQCVISMLDYYHHSKACFVAHSLGTALVSWMLHDPSGAKKVASSVLLDPITFLLCDPTVASVFVYKDPVNTIDLLMHFFLSRELFIANALSRHFAWSHNILFIEDLLNNKECCRAHRHLVVPTNKIGGEEGLMSMVGTLPSPASSLALSSMHSSHADTSATSGLHYKAHTTLEHTIILSSHDSIVPVPSVYRYLEAKRLEGYRSFETLTFQGFHGEMLLHPQWIATITKKIQERCELLK